MFEALKKYADFKGRASRKEYWLFVLLSVIAVFLAVFIDTILETFVLTAVVGLALIVPSFSALARRMHDTGRSGWWILVYFIPFVGAFVVLVLAVLPGEAGENRFGPNPYSIDPEPTETA